MLLSCGGKFSGGWQYLSPTVFFASKTIAACALFMSVVRGKGASNGKRRFMRFPSSGSLQEGRGRPAGKRQMEKAQGPDASQHADVDEGLDAGTRVGIEGVNGLRDAIFRRLQASAIHIENKALTLYGRALTAIKIDLQNGEIKEAEIWDRGNFLIHGMKALGAHGPCAFDFDVMPRAVNRRVQADICAPSIRFRPFFLAAYSWRSTASMKAEGSMRLVGMMVPTPMLTVSR